MSAVEDLSKLTLQGTNLLLVEMPFEKWSSKVIKEVLDLGDNLGVTPVLAHIERFFSYQKNLDWIYEFKDAGILMQMNAEYILGTFSSHKAMKLIKNHAVDFLGSDTHNTTDRKPNLGPAIEKIAKKAGDEIMDRFIRYEETYAPRN
jgi:protein-tyrosine phosphatase